ncbi:MAG: hypothetical protein HGA25_10390 [Clostridiales bacterium]|nr:hypothetical protein [Clostridiales bacterium]
MLVLQEDSEALFEWGVFSGFQKSIEQKEIVPLSDKNLPIAEGCNVWGKDTNVCLQHPKASVELIAWDETYLIILSKDKKLVDCFMKLYPEAESLEQYNTRVFDKEKNINE